MASFQSNIGWKSIRRRENKFYRSVPFRSRHVIENSNKIAKKLKNIIVASFQAKVGWKRLKKIENKNYRSVLFPPYE